MMASWLHDYLNQAGSDGLHADLAHHAPFYAVCQAIFYVFCFRSQQLLELDKGRSLRLQWRSFRPLSLSGVLCT